MVSISVVGGFAATGDCKIVEVYAKRFVLRAFLRPWSWGYRRVFYGARLFGLGWLGFMLWTTEGASPW